MGNDLDCSRTSSHNAHTLVFQTGQLWNPFARAPSRYVVSPARSVKQVTFEQVTALSIRQLCLIQDAIGENDKVCRYLDARPLPTLERLLVGLPIGSLNQRTDFRVLFYRGIPLASFRRPL